jgi:PQQ-dependent dehydrogenase (s-GDH family)
MKLFAAVSLLAIGIAAPALAQSFSPDQVVDGSEQFEMKVVATGLEGPWEVTWGPDDKLWVTERVGRRIVQIDPATGEKVTLFEVAEARAPGGQDGLMGLALHPELLQGSGNDYVYAAYTYEDESIGGNAQVADRFSPYKHLYTKIVRLTYDAAANRLADPVNLIAGMPASNDHNSGRLKVGPDGKLYYTIGDGGNNQLGNWCIPIQSQTLPTAEQIVANDYFAYQGKSLRLELDGAVPSDNPEIAGVQSHIFTYGHRNPQGLDFGPDGTLYSTEHGPKADDEVNVLQPGGNYGWPNVSGYKDDMAYQYARWADATTPCSQLEFTDLAIHPSVPVEDETAFSADIVEPIASLFNVPSDYSFEDPICGGINFICWPTVAPSSIEHYEGDIPGWSNSLIVTTLKRGSLYRIPLNEDGVTVAGTIERYFQSENRFRDLAISPDGKSIYVATDPGGLAEKTGGGVVFEMQNPGSILVFTYTGGDTAAAVADPAGMAEVEAQVAAAGNVPAFTTEQVDRGRTAYNANCVSCHGQNLITANYGPPLAGRYFDGKWRGQTVAALYTHTHDRMPPSQPGKLGDETYADLVALILSVNGVAPGDRSLPTNVDQLGEMIIPLAQ